MIVAPQATVTEWSAPLPYNSTFDASVDVAYKQFRVTFVAPPYPIGSVPAAYRSLQITVAPDDGVTAPFTLQHSGLLLYTALPCVEGELLVYRSGVPTCGSCPTGGFCPGAGRVYPRKSYWAYSEWATPVPCAVSEACPGAIGELEAYPVVTTEDGARLTQRCTAAYTGDFCAKCSAGHYPQGSRCLSCGETESDRQQQRFLIAAAVIIFTVLTAAVAVLPSSRLAFIITALIALQQFVVLAKSSIQQLPEGPAFTRFAEFIGFISVINFDVQMVKPGCVLPTLTFVDLYWATLVVVLVAAVMFVVGAALRATWVYHFRLKPAQQRTKLKAAAAAASTGPNGPIKVPASPANTTAAGARSPSVRSGGNETSSTAKRRGGWVWPAVRSRRPRPVRRWSCRRSAPRYSRRRRCAPHRCPPRRRPPNPHRPPPRIWPDRPVRATPKRRRPNA